MFIVGFKMRKMKLKSGYLSVQFRPALKPKVFLFLFFSYIISSFKSLVFSIVIPLILFLMSVVIAFSNPEITKGSVSKRLMGLNLP